MTEVSRGGRPAGWGACPQTEWNRSDCARAQRASRGGGGGRGFLTSEQALQVSKACLGYAPSLHKRAKLCNNLFWHLVS